MPSLNGIAFSLHEESYFSPGRHLTMHLFRVGGERPGDTPYSEVLPVGFNTRRSDFCAPDDAQYHVCRTDQGRIRVRVFAKEMPGSPALDWVFPKENDVGCNDELYREFIAGIG